nr:FecR domain-containing protein [Burkholderia pyrrocinia]
MSLSSAAIAQPVAILVSGPLFEYSIRTADTLYDLAAQYLNAPTDWVTLQQINRVRDPKRLQPGTTLRIPVSMLKNARLTARIIAVTGQAETFGRDANARAPLHVGAVLAEGDHVRTGERSFATIELSDGSHIALLPATTVWIRRLRDVGATHAIDRRFEIDEGGIETRVSPLKPQDSYDVTTPSLIAGVRGTAFRVAYVPDTRRTLVEVLDGTVRVARAAAPDSTDAALVTRGFGIAATNGRITGLRALQAAPALSQSVQVQAGREIAFELTAVPNARHYRAVIATDAGFLNIIDDARSAGTRVACEDRAPGTYFVRISALDENDIEGRSRIYSFTRTDDPSRRTGPAHFEFRWTDETGVAAGAGWHFKLAANDGFDEPLVDQHGLAGNRLVLSNLPDGTYYWSVSAESTADEADAPQRPVIQSFSVRP